MQKYKADTDIETGNYEKVYLIYGDEAYLVMQYKNKLKKAIIGNEESMNYAYFDTMPDKIEKITHFADTMPFFGDRRLVILDKLQAFKKDIGLADYIPLIPETTTIVIVEDEVDKRNRLYKSIQKYGCVMELKKLTIQDLKLFVAGRMKSAGKGIRESDCEYLIENVGDDLNVLRNEVDKCISFSGTSPAIDRNMIDTVCSMQIENKIFDMVDSIIKKNGSRTYELYANLLALRENVFGIMAVIRNNYSRMLIVRELLDKGCSPGEIASRTKTADWLAKKEISKVKSTNCNKLKAGLEIIADTERSIKIGNISEQLGMELMIAKLLET